MPPRRDLIAMLVLAAIGALCIWLSSGCEALDTAEATIADHGTVYVCSPGCSASPPEYCWDGSRADLESLLGATCHEETIDERWWPAVAGCAYCCGADCPPGCDAHQGCFCPPEGS